GGGGVGNSGGVAGQGNNGGGGQAGAFGGTNAGGMAGMTAGGGGGGFGMGGSGARARPRPPICTPGNGSCKGNAVVRCNATGTGFITTPCDETKGFFCDAVTLTCADPCSQMLVGTSNVGCEYFPTVTSNGALYSGFHFAVSVANATLAPA